jgi:hypothetical protein
MTVTRAGSFRHVRSRIFAIPSSFFSAGSSDGFHRPEANDQLAPVLDEDRPENVLLGREVVVEKSVRHPCVLGDVADTRAVIAVLGEHADRGFEDALALLGDSD